MLSWDDFRYVKAIADARSLSAAATSLGVNHSTVFRRLGQIEQATAMQVLDADAGELRGGGGGGGAGDQGRDEGGQDAADGLHGFSSGRAAVS